MRLFLSALPLLAVTPALAQQATGSDPVVNLQRAAPPPPADDPRRQGPELDVFRSTPTPTPTPTPSLPPIVAPTVTPAQRAPAPIQRPPAATPAPQRQTPARTETPAAERSTPAPKPADRPAARVTTPTEPSPPPIAAAPEPDNAANAVQPPPAALPAPEPVPVDNGTAVAPEAAPVPESEGLSWPWILAAIAAIAVIAGGLLLRRRRGQAAPLPEPAPLPAPIPTATAAETPPAPAQPRPEPMPAPAPPAPPAAAPTPDAPLAVTDDGDRPWIDLALDIGLARYSLMGVTIGYTLVLHNRGNRVAQDILVRGILGNAGAQQEELLRHFFAGETGLPLHSVVSLPAGETLRIASELRLGTEQIQPVEMSGRSLLIPIAAFDAHYRWADADDTPLGAGRTGRAFIVGQDKDPPADRLAPFRLDEGPRQYRRPAARAAAEVQPT
ncbi:hypothetical protein PMI04_019060 [Sphingobium sp. AP49]|uniref:hypothetical protein n=1 Tax=Sphingobium sp. AP49 TaxID=1144307 RepID=UPI00026ED747|nr:hypothetical protein [Sphingobium sp. AP49]WHO38612.1 hypothetical protein PMI04_019060 [Sphingobium sp. AP49]